MYTHTHTSCHKHKCSCFSLHVYACLYTKKSMYLSMHPSIFLCYMY